MKIKFTICFLIVLGILNQEQKIFGQVGLQNIKICVISDVHYFDTSLLVNDGPAFEEYLNSDRKLLRESYAITESLIDSLISGQPDIVLVSGDITKDGELVCHQKMTEYFGELESSGAQVFVCPGNHDINNPMAVAFDGDITYPVPGINPDEFKSIYGGFGFNDAIAVDTASLSYVAEPFAGLQIISMDVCRYDSNYINNFPQTSGGFKPQVLEWIKDRVIDACGQGKIVMGLMHHNFAEHFTNQKRIFSEYVQDDWETVSAQLTDLGMKIVFTGHFHAQDMVSKMTSSGKPVLDVETGSVVTWPCPYRICTLGTDSVLTVTGKRVEDIDYDTGGLPFQEYAFNDLESGLPPIIVSLLMGPPYNLSQGLAEYIEPAFTETMIAHYNGNEGDPSANTEWIMFWMWLFGYDYIADAMDGVWNDESPDDWNTTIDLSPAENRLVLELTAFLEGPFTGSEMSTLLNSEFIPLSQPYSGEPWFYTGSPGVSTIPGDEIVDWILVEIRDAATAGQATGAKVVGRQAAFILNDGSVVAPDGISNLRFYHTIHQQLFSVVRHRNHPGIMSANPLTMSGGIYSYDFSSGSSQVYGGTAGSKEIATGVWGMFSGDGNADGSVGPDDKSIWSLSSGISGYKPADFNLDGEVSNKDKNDNWLINLNASSQIPE